jgi:osmoprotectant transport system substrate-binding protein
VRSGGLALAPTVAAVLGGCGGQASTPTGDVTADDAITVGSFGFPESDLLAAIYTGALRDAGIDAERVTVGPRELLLPALERGLIEVVPEYQGSLVSFLGGRPSADPDEIQRRLETLLEPVGLRAAAPASAQDRNAVVVTAPTSVSLGLTSVSDLRGIAGSLRFGGPPECPERPLCLLGLEGRYGLRFGSFVPLDVGGPLTVQALHRGFVDAAILFTTDPALATGDLVALKDDRGLQPSERVVPILRADAIDRFGPGAVAALDAVSAGLTTETLRAMNARVAGGEPAEAVAEAYLDGLAMAGVG